MPKIRISVGPTRLQGLRNKNATNGYLKRLNRGVHISIRHADPWHGQVM